MTGKNRRALSVKEEKKANGFCRSINYLTPMFLGLEKKFLQCSMWKTPLLVILDILAQTPLSLGVFPYLPETRGTPLRFLNALTSL